MLKITGPRVLIRPLAKNEKTESGLLYIPDVVSQDEESAGTVVALGSGPVTAKGVKLDHFVKVGDTVLFSPYVGQETDAFGERMFVMREEDILGVIESEERE